MKSGQESGGAEALVKLAALEARLAAQRARAEASPLGNPILLFAIDTGRRIDRGEIGFTDLDQIARKVMADAFIGRAERLGRYLGETDPDRNLSEIIASFEHIADSGDFDFFRTRLERPAAGIVLTAHPTFAIPLQVARALTELACARTSTGDPVDQAGRAERMHLAETEPHRPPDNLTLEIEHAWSLEVLENLHDALDAVRRNAFGVARARFPARWTELVPRPLTLGSWVGYDLDGRSDVTSLRTFAVRLADKQAALARYRRCLAGVRARTASSGNALQAAEAMLQRASAAVEMQQRMLAEAERDELKLAEFSRAMVAGRSHALTSTAPLVALLDEAIREAVNDEQRLDLLVMQTAIKAHGLGLAQVHVRLNASQLHNAMRRRIGLHSEPNDVANRRSYFNAINELLAEVQPATINFATLMTEEASARRLMMTVAQMVKFVDSSTPVRFLIAETETGFTLLTALYYARLFGIEAQVEISPLFETAEAFERGERIIEEALRSRIYRAHLQKTGRCAVQFGYSDSGRFIGQMAATFRIERLRLRLTQLLERHALQSVEVILFNTHGESIGRGGHPNTLSDRLRYLAPQPNRAEFARRGIRTREEVSFQGGDGFLNLLTPAGALAVVARMLDFASAVEVAEPADPIYSAPDYAAEFFATVQQEFSALVADPDYASLLNLFGTRMLYRAGSRPSVRENQEFARPAEITRPAQLRAIPNNAILQQTGFLANTLHGLGPAVAKDPEMFAAMRDRSQRFRRALFLVTTALELSDLDVMQSYAHIFDPGFWLLNSGRARASRTRATLRELAGVTERLKQFDRVARAVRRLRRDHLLLLEHLKPVESPRRSRLLLLHGLRLALVMRIATLATAIPPFSPQRGVTREGLIAQIMMLDVPAAVEQLRHIFPLHQPVPGDHVNFGESSTYQPESELSYAVEHKNIFEPLLRLFELTRLLGSAVGHEIGAMG